MELRRALVMVFVVSLFFALIGYVFSAWFLVGHAVIVGIYMWIPGLCSIYLMKKEGIKIAIFKRIQASFFYASLLPLAIVVLGVFFSLCFAQFSLERVLLAASAYHLKSAYPLVNVSVFVVCLYFISLFTSLTLNFFFVLGEELFWRGYLWKKMQCLGFWRGSFYIGLLWALWYVPPVLFFGYSYPKHPFLGVVLMSIFCLAINPLLIYLREVENSVMSATIFHAMVNAFCPICIVFFPQANHFLIAPLGIAGMLSIATISIGFVYFKMKVVKKLFN